MKTTILTESKHPLGQVWTRIARQAHASIWNHVWDRVSNPVYVQVRHRIADRVAHARTRRVIGLTCLPARKPKAESMKTPVKHVRSTIKELRQRIFPHVWWLLPDDVLDWSTYLRHVRVNYQLETAITEQAGAYLPPRKLKP